ncbi:hypothetical protein F441_00681 [Phytophthora nicotianae CJ01A1]|uniref:Uncharacterized protein n=4 Tax=Phytophthora nicotianae TaxID=4792 RepID=W2M0C3_PHYNI|nr:hypothetical protein L915_00649 [Phytophthora nicotianae]ETL50048.1 hypothetical protein L916_00654 [Phytophthora nicotianae]ETM03112.1 hypothetical protein L917_00622 [Phytophthora nicotianae]ETO85680.1 hypothetical protein F444_00685 [Phytophthora nicotianae P1976]ETP26717.1 hypothetical protein F441_00681 [Phytophthora nicotianae CJ01A1]
MEGIRYVRSLIDESRAKGKWNDFWRYFVKTWVERYDATTWNVQEMVRYEVDIINRTNNPLEKPPIGVEIAPHARHYRLP